MSIKNEGKVQALRVEENVIIIARKISEDVFNVTYNNLDWLRSFPGLIYPRKLIQPKKNMGTRSRNRLFHI